MDPLAIAVAAIINLETPLIPRELLFGNPERTGVCISPDGSMLGSPCLLLLLFIAVASGRHLS